MSAPLGRVGLETVDRSPVRLLRRRRTSARPSAKALISDRPACLSGVLTCIDPSPTPNRSTFVLAEICLDLRTLGIEVDQGPCWSVRPCLPRGTTLLHVLRPHANDGGDGIRLWAVSAASRSVRVRRFVRTEWARRARSGHWWAGDRGCCGVSGRRSQSLQFLGQAPGRACGR